MKPTDDTDPEVERLQLERWRTMTPAEKVKRVVDLNAAVRAMIDIRRGVMPDPRINIRIKRHVRDLAIVLLLDLSESLTLGVQGGGTTGKNSFDDQSRAASATAASRADASRTV